MMVGKGQPPKDPEDKRIKTTIGLSPKERAKIDEAKEQEAPDKGLGQYIRDVTLNHADNVLKKKPLKKQTKK